MIRKWYVRHGLAFAVAVFVAGPLIVLDGPQGIENAIYPPVTDIRHKVVKNTADQVCIRTTFKRNRKASAVAISWTARGVFGDRVFLLVRRATPAAPGVMMLRPDDVGAKIKYVNCHDRPKRFHGGPYAVTVRVHYAVPQHNFWLLIREDDPIKVPELGAK